MSDSLRAPAVGMRPRGLWWRTVGAAAAFVVVNAVAFTLMLTHLAAALRHNIGESPVGAFHVGTELVTPLLGWVWFQSLLNGIALVIPPRTQPLGVGVLLVVAVVAACAG
ncbi:hypothetical protein [Nocardioides cynanchi]|uniref:hypothetical protein n=1 Tax=Nocardioides cynanchi TaxID=2558918 RepID=UPI001244351B|nr:hypothetical protein [Nocardioides cynanchi]